MPTVPLGELALKFQDGPFGSNLKSSHYVDDGVRVVRLQNIGAGSFDDRDRAYIAPNHFAKLAKHECRPGDVLIATLGDPILRAAVQPDSVPIALNKADCIQLRCDPKKASPQYVTHFLNSRRAQAQAAALAHGQTRPRINLSQLRDLPVPTPSVTEQRRIAAVLDSAMALRVERRRSLDKLNVLAQALFVELFADGAASTAELSDVADVQGGLQVTSKREQYPLDVPYLRVANVHRGALDLTQVKSLRVMPAELTRTRLIAGDLLVVEGHGNREEIGRVAIWDGSVDPCVHQNHLIRVRCDESRVLPRYAEAYLNSHIGRRTLLRAANTTSGLNTISTSDVRSVQLPLPPLSDQRRFVAAIEVVDERIAEMRRSEQQLNTLFAALQQRAFRGEL